MRQTRRGSHRGTAVVRRRVEVRKLSRFDSLRPRSASFLASLGGLTGLSSPEYEHADEIGALIWSWGVSNDGTVHVGGGASCAKVNVQDFSFTKWMDNSLRQHFCSLVEPASGQSRSFQTICRPLAIHMTTAGIGVDKVLLGATMWRRAWNSKRCYAEGKGTRTPPEAMFKSGILFVDSPARFLYRKVLFTQGLCPAQIPRELQN